MSQLAFVTSEEEQTLFLQTHNILPTDRPPTRKQVWEYVRRHYVETELKTEEEATAYAQSLWVSNYVHYVNFYGWDKPPDWTEGEPVVREACPRKVFPAVPDHVNRIEVYRLMQLQKGGSCSTS